MSTRRGRACLFRSVSPFPVPSRAVQYLIVAVRHHHQIHVDAASGGFFAPFATPSLKWDFQLPRVVSINASGHKYGKAYVGVGIVVWRDKKHRPFDAYSSSASLRLPSDTALKTRQFRRTWCSP